MPEAIRIRLDQGSLTRSSDGKLTMGGNAGCVSWGFIIFAALGTAGSAAAAIYSLFQPSAGILELLYKILLLLGLTAFFGFVAFHLFRNARRGKVTIDPATRLIQIRDHEIPFAQVETLLSRDYLPPLMEGAVVVTFYAVLIDGEQMSLGSISGNAGKMVERSTQILGVIGEAINKPVLDWKR